MRPAAVVALVLASVLMLLVVVSCGALMYGCGRAVQMGCQRQPGAITCQQG